MSSDVLFYCRKKQPAQPVGQTFQIQIPNHTQFMNSNDEYIKPPSEFLVSSQMSAFESSISDDDALKMIKSVEKLSQKTVESWPSSKESSSGSFRKRNCMPPKNCQICHKCNTILEPQDTIMNNGTTYCYSCFKSFINTPQFMRCQKCSAAKNSRSLIIDGLCFCPEHFRCQCCQAQLTPKSYRQQNGKYYCIDHVPKIKCAKCMCDILSHSIQALGKYYHINCFKCSVCSEPIETQQFTLCDNNPICSRCYKAQANIGRRSVSWFTANLR